MSGAGDDLSDLDRIQGPPTPPPDQPDERTANEIRRAKAKPPTPTERWAAEVDRHHASLDKERLRLLDKNEELHRQVARLGPENARLRESHGNLIANNFVAVGLMTAGSGLISVAGYGGNEIIRAAVVLLGVGATASGLIVSAVTNLRGRRNQRMATGPDGEGPGG